MSACCGGVGGGGVKDAYTDLGPFVKMGFLVWDRCDLGQVGMKGFLVGERSHLYHWQELQER